MIVEDITLLREYARTQSEAAFAALVSRHINLVYSVARRQTHDETMAEEITQMVFIILARKARSFDSKTILPSWLCRTARYCCANALTTNRRRRQREQEVYLQSIMNEPEPDPWGQIAPLLDAAMSELGEKDHSAIVLRFFQGHDLKTVGTALGASEGAARMRVDRALEKLRKFFVRRGVALSAVAMAGALSAHATQAAPLALAATVTTAAVQGTGAATSTLTLKGALKIMAWMKMKTIIVTSIVLVVAAGTTAVTVKQVEAHKTYEWQTPNVSVETMNRVPPQVKIVPSKFSQFHGMGGEGSRAMGIGVTMDLLFENAYQVQRARMVLPTDLPQTRYDFIASLSSGSSEAMQQEIKSDFGLMGKWETRSTDVLLLKVAHPDAPGLIPTTGGKKQDWMSPGGYTMKNQPVGKMATGLENYFEIPVLDETGLDQPFDISLAWDEQKPRDNPAALKKALLDELGLELVPDRRAVRVLVVEKAK